MSRCLLYFSSINAQETLSTSIHPSCKQDDLNSFFVFCYGGCSSDNNAISHYYSSFPTNPLKPFYFELEFDSDVLKAVSRVTLEAKEIDQISIFLIEKLFFIVTPFITEIFNFPL